MKSLFYSCFNIGRMNQKHLWTVVAVVSTVLGTPLIGRSETTQKTAQASPTQPSGDVVKVGEYKSPTANPVSNATAIAKIHTHETAGRPAATLYIRDIPVLTFTGNKSVASTETKVGEIANTNGVYKTLDTSSATKVATTGGTGAVVGNQANSAQDDPVQRASVVAAKVNQLVLDKVDAGKITVSWRAKDASTAVSQSQNKSLPAQDTPSGRFLIKANGKELVEINENTRLADTTKDLAQDALQATNRLRRLIGNASPLNGIADLPPVRVPMSIPKLPQKVAGQVLATFRGIASFYGYDFAGNRTATGERFNPEGMTAAHRSLPFGTRVRVTNTRNGRSVVVRINDRGPFIRGRVIDLSTGAARVLGMIGSGLAPVRIEVLGR
ncbi:MAG: septal ring lytic transglycosylase RlpA family protein [Chlorogloeopsis fritschii C42_A2020_084]|jgi:rare lipoprotein A|nr:septal ring lytic transglycosylase RlpA family protein [Chlorogloeopsis fritschii C42_A2020_084]